MENKRISAAIILLCSCWGFVSISLAGEGTTRDKGSLRGLKGIAVLIEPISPAAEKAGLSETQLQTAVERRLRRARIPILPESEGSAVPGIGDLCIRATTLKPFIGDYSFYIEVKLNQTVRLERDEFASEYTATTWNSGGYLGTIRAGQMSGKVQEVVGNQVDEFINDYLAANRM